MFNRLARKKLEALRKMKATRKLKVSSVNAQMEIKYHKTEKKHYDGKRTEV